MKKIIKGFIIALLLTININVYAEDAWPKTISHNDFTISIEGFDLKAYRFDADEETKTITNTDDEGNTITLTTTDSGENYLYENPQEIINLKPSDFTIEPEFKDDKLYDVDSLFVYLKLNLTKEKLIALLTDEGIISDVDDTGKISYYIELVVNYKILEYPEKYQFAFKRNYIRSILNGRNYEKDLDLTQTNYQVLNLIRVQYNKQTEQIDYSYDTTLNEDNSDFAKAVLNYEVFKEDNSDENDKTFILLFHNMDNIEYLIDNYSSIIKEPLDDEVNPITATQVKVPNTAMNIPIMFYLLCGLIIMMGIAILFIATYRNEKKSYIS